MAKEETTVEKTVAEEVELDATALNAISDKVIAGLSPIVTKTVEAALEKKAEKSEEVTQKSIFIGTGSSKKMSENMSKEVRLIRALRALKNHEYDVVREYNKISIDLRAKANYGNSTTDADGGYLIPDPDFDAQVARLEESYGVAFQYADIRQVNSDSVKVNKKSTGFDFTETSQAGVKTGVKMSFAQTTKDLRKFAAIAPATDELTEDAAIDYWAEITKEAARARAKKADQLMFTDTTSGILKTSGVKTETIGTAFTDLDWDDMIRAESKVNSQVLESSTGAWFMHPTVWYALILKKGSANDHYLFQPSQSSTVWNPRTPTGRQVIFTNVLPAVGDITANEAFAVFGDPKQFRLYQKRGLQLTMLTEGTVKDAGGSDFNLATQDGQALRMVTRMLGLTNFADAFCVVGTGTVS